MEILILILTAICCFIFSSMVHELGHILVGLKEGFKFYIFIAGPFGLKRNENDKIVFYIEKDISLWGGLGATVPRYDNEDNYRKFGHILLGGPIASIFFGAIALSLAIITSNKLFLLFGVMSLSMGVVSLIPLRNGAFYTDGGRWLRMHKSEKTKIVEMALWNLTQKTIIQGNYTHANLAEIMILINDDDMRTQYLGHYYAYNFYKDNKDIANSEKEKEELDKLKRKVPKQMVTMFSVD